MPRSGNSSPADYVPLISSNPSDEQGWEKSLSNTDLRSTTRSEWLWTALVSLLAVASAIFSFASSSVPTWPRDPAGLPILTPEPNIEKAAGFYKMKSAPGAWFPGKIVHVSSTEPDTLSAPGSHVLLSATDSTYFRWYRSFPDYALCYITPLVSNTSALLSIGKSYTSTGDISHLEVWNVTAPSSAFKSGFTWNDRPQRLNFMGTVNFSSTYMKEAEPGWQLKKPTPRFDCSGMKEVTVEITCPQEDVVANEACRLEFEQVFSEPALSFDLQDLK